MQHTNQRHRRIFTVPKLQKKYIKLPAEIHDIFESIENPAERNAYIIALRDAGWTLQSIADVSEISRERVRQIVKVEETPVLTSPLNFPIPEVPLLEERKPAVYNEPNPEALQRLLELQPLAQKVRSGTRYREEAEEYSAILNRLHSEDGVPVYRLAKRLGITSGAVRFRLARYGYKVPTSNPTSRVYKQVITENRVLLNG
jgi:hypothetical protein